MAASSKPTGVHYALVVFVLISIVCCLGWLLAYKGSNSISDLRRERDDAKDKAEKATRLANSLQDGIKNIRDLLGAKFEDPGDATGSSPASVTGDMAKMIGTYAKGAAEKTYNATLVKQDELLRATTAARD